MKHIHRYISEAFSWQEAKSYLFECLDRTDDYNFELTLESCPKLADYYCLSELNISREFRNYPEYIYLALIVVNEEDQYSGYGTGFMEDLCEWADTRGKIITLTPDDDFGASSVSRLIKFYKRFGFVENKGKNTDFTHKQFMHRKPNVTEAVARRTSGKYKNAEVTAFPDNPMYDNIMDWIKYNGIKINDIGNYDWKDIDRNMGKGVALKGHGYVTHDIILCPIRDHEHAYCFKFKNGEDKIYEATLYSRSSDGVYGQSIWVSQIIGYINDLDRKHNFITEAVANRKVGKYSTKLRYDPIPTYQYVIDWLKDNHIDISDSGKSIYWRIGTNTGNSISTGWRDVVNNNLGKGVATTLSEGKNARQIILFPSETPDKAYGFRFLYSDKLYDGIFYTKTGDTISCDVVLDTDVIRRVNELDVKKNFITEAVSHGRNPNRERYDNGIQLVGPVSEYVLDKWIADMKIKKEIVVDFLVSRYKMDKFIKSGIGTGICYKNVAKSDYSWYLFCPKGKDFAIQIYTNGDGGIFSAYTYIFTNGGTKRTSIEEEDAIRELEFWSSDFVTEAVANRRTGKYNATPIGVGMTLDEFEEFLRVSHIDLEEERGWDYGFGCGDGMCHVFDMKGNRKGYVEYIVCPKYEKFRFNVRFSMGRFDSAYIEDEIAGQPSANLARGYAEVLEKLYDYYK